MLTLFFLKRFYGYFLVLVTVFIGIFSSINLFLRFSALQTLGLIPIIFMTMMPMVALFAIPFASLLAIQFVFINVISESEKLFFFYSKPAQKALWVATVLFSLSLVSFYTPLVLQWAPAAYNHGKILLLEMAQQEISELRPYRLHTLGSGLILFFEGKNIEKHGAPRFNKLFIAFTDKSNKHYLFSAQYGLIDDGMLTMFNGSLLQQETSKPSSYATFEQASIGIYQFLRVTKIIDTSSTKLMPIKKLLHNKDTSLDARIELHKRCAQVLWLFLFPLLALVLVLYRNVSSFGFTYAIFYAGLSYVAMHAFLLLSTYCSSKFLFMIPSFYLAPIALFGIVTSYCRLKNI